MFSQAKATGFEFHHLKVQEEKGKISPSDSTLADFFWGVISSDSKLFFSSFFNIVLDRIFLGFGMDFGRGWEAKLLPKSIFGVLFLRCFLVLRFS